MGLIDDLQHSIHELREKISNLEKERGSIPKSLTPFNRSIKATARTHGRAWVPLPLYGIHLGVCVDTRDPWKMGRIKVYCPVVHNLKRAKYLSESTLDWVMPCSSFGGIDDVGSVFVPPEGSAVLIMFENGNRESMYYVGSTWVPKKADPEINNSDFSPQRERYRWGDGSRRNSDIKNGLTDSLLPPFNNESYFGNDLKPEGTLTADESVSALNINANDTQNIQVVGSLDQQRTGVSGDGYSTQGWRSKDIPHMYGIKSPEKHFILFDDGSYERERKLWGKRVVLQSSKGNTLILKDDNDQTAEEIFQHPFWDSYNDSLSGSGGQPFSKVGNQHAIELNHTGIQLQSLGGGRLIIDDKIQGDVRPFQNEWNINFPPQPESGQKLYRTMVRLESHTEHRITLSDHHEDQENIRSDKDGIFLSSACGHYIGMIDHTSMDGKADENRKIHIKSTSGHQIEMKDYKCSIQSPKVRATGRYQGTGQRGYRDDGVYDDPNFQPDGKGSGEQVCLKITSGFGQYLLFEDGSNQEKPTEQFIQLSNAPGYNDPYNFLKMNQVTNRKLVHLNCAGERLTTVEENYTRVTQGGETLIANENQVHIVQEQNMIDIVQKQNLVQYVALGNHVIFCRQGQHLTYALNGTAHLSLTSPHIILGGVPPEGGEPPDGAAPVLLLGGEAPLPAHPSNWLIAN